MINLLRNPEIKRTLIAFGVFAIPAIISAYLWHIPFGNFTLILCLILFIIFLISTYKRYKKISLLSSEINRILHGDNKITFSEFSEGELGILQSEIYKMTVRLREYSQKLKEDKIYLADSLADISHQIRTPLTSINLLISFLSEPNISEERRLKLTHELYELLSRIDWLITALLKISKLDAGTIEFKKEKISLKELIDKAISPLLVPIELKEQTIETDSSGFFEGDILWTSEALGNIIKNCTEHTPLGGKIKISASENALYSEIIISDNGSGISEEDLPHIFERFYKGKTAGDKGFGIGLSLSRMIINSQGGYIKAENNKGSGTLFTIRFYKGTV